jgi:hypothetical protein
LGPKRGTPSRALDPASFAWSGAEFTVRPTFRCDVKWPGVPLAVAPSDRQRCDQPLYVAHSRYIGPASLLERAGDVIS